MMGKIVKVAVIVIAICMFTTMVACTTTKTGESTTSTVEETTTEKTTAEETTKPPEPVTLTLFSAFTLAVDGVQDDPVAKEIQRVTGITMDIFSGAGGNTDVKEILAARIASNDLTDMVEILDLNQRMNVIKAGLVIPLDDLVQKFGPNLTNDPQSALRILYQRKYDSPDGKLYAIKTLGGGGQNPYGPVEANYIRWSVYDKIGRPPIKTSDDLLNVLKQMQEASPKTPSGKKVYGMGYWFGDSQVWGDWPLSCNFAAGWALPGSTQGYCWGDYSIATDDFVGPTPVTNPDSVFYSFIKFFNKAWRMGLIDPESFTQKYDQYSNNIAEGRYLHLFFSPAVAAAEAEVQKTIKDDGWVVVPPLDGSTKMIINLNTSIGTRSWLISKTCKNPERAIQLLDYAASTEGNRLILSGIKGVNYTEVNGKLRFTAEEIEKSKQPGYSASSGIGKYGPLAGISGRTKLQDGSSADLNGDIDVIMEKLPQFKKTAADHFGFPDKDGGTKQLKVDFLDTIYCNLNPNLNSDLKKIEADVTSYMFKNVFRLIRTNSDAEWNTVLNEMVTKAKELGAETVFAQRKKTLDDARPDIEILFEKIYGPRANRQ